MRRLWITVVAVATAAASVACGPRAGTLEAANAALGAAQMNSIQFSGTGRWYQFGQAPNPTLPWPQFDVSSYTATVDYAAPAARVQMTRLQTVEADRVRPTPAEQKPDQYVSGTTAWNMAAPAGAPRRSRTRTATAARRRRRTSHGDLDDAARVPQGGGREQCDVAPVRGWFRCVVLSREEQVRWHDQRAERGRAS